MKKIIIILGVVLLSFTANSTTHIINVWDGYFQFVGGVVTIQLGDTVQWLPLDIPMMVHTITSTNIPSQATAFDQIWQAPADTFFQYIPLFVGLYEYECTPHAIEWGMIGSINVIDDANGITDGVLSVSDLLMYPNPTTDFIQFNSSIVYPYNIFTASGRLILSAKTDEIIDVSTWANGNYFIDIVADKPRIMKFIKE